MQDHPVMVEVVSDDKGGLDAKNTQAIITNLLLYKGALDKCNMSIQKYNQLATY